MLNPIVNELHVLKLGAMADQLVQWMNDPSNQAKSHLDCIAALVHAQAQSAANKRVQGVLRRAELPPGITLADVRAGESRGLPDLLLANLATSEWIRRGQTVVITGSSRCGKTYLAAALAREAALVRLSVFYARTPELLATCAIAKSTGQWPALIKRLKRFHLVILDDFATERANAEQSHLLRQIIDNVLRKEHALMVASPNDVLDWGDYFEDPTAADAIYGRLLEQVHRIALKCPPSTAVRRPKHQPSARNRV